MSKKIFRILYLMIMFGFQWHITDRCPNRCLHCYQSDFGAGAEQSLRVLTGIADDIMAAVDGPVSINVTGGEPLLYQHPNQHVFELMAHLSTFDNLDELNIITSAYGVDALTIDRLKAIPKLTSVKISLESHDPQINDHIRGLGSFESTTRSINALAQAGLSVIIMATLGKHNYRSVEGLCELAAGLGARGVIFERYVPLGRGLGIRDFVLTSHEWTEILNAICRAVDMDAESSIHALLPYKAFYIDIPHGSTAASSRSLNAAPCCLGPTSMALMPDGTVYPCRRVPEAVGRLPEDGMERVLEALGGYLERGGDERCYGLE